ncbi:MAG: hypothetical protein UW93_C0010G0010 [Parcubacteria group bacterium GW2011_GWC1_45_13]|uniref:Uncharacterized protein n=1 Tax=Candidatus Giovannonibacteria bacterium GW2011_GWA1_44_29 TaxID=1618646 RepID=A0A0G1L3V0_9BACT|nr:MAG: hypothetical protein UW57_C0009G0008 [Candidatus Giovannonibacteria bacterium GW2011_GWA1_44_29]KKT91238.1 MAG: hypothetical protein UW93_C0010G0010 [Parcubacteria group bacterium GW2011_GWC1_45_13]
MTISKLFGNITIVLNQLIGILFIVATLAFLWGVIQYVLASGDEKKLAEGKKYIIYGLIGLFVMLSMWGIVTAVRNTLFNTGGGNTIPRCIDVGGPPPPCTT